jgi:hypothetical protein
MYPRYFEDDMVPIKSPTKADWYEPACGMTSVHLSGDGDWAEGGPWSHNAWGNAKAHSIQLLQKRFGADRKRRAETKHVPLLLDSCIMTEIGDLWEADLAYTTGKGDWAQVGKSAPHPDDEWKGKGNLQFITMSQNYMVDRGEPATCVNVACTQPVGR